MSTLRGEETRSVLADKTHRLLVERLCVAMRGILLAVPLFALGEWWLGRGAAPALYLVKLVQVVMAFVVLRALRTAAQQRHAVALALLAAGVLCATTAASNILLHDAAMSPPLLSVLTVGFAATFPWGLVPQSVTVVMMLTSGGDAMAEARCRELGVAAL